MWCGHHLPADARRCLLCGRSAPSAEIELEQIDVTAAPPSGQRVVVGDPLGPRRDGRRLAAVGAAMVVLLALVIVLSDSGGGGDDAAGEPSSTTAPPDGTWPRARDRAAARDAIPTTTTAWLGDRPGPVLGVETGGLSLYVASDRTLARIELDSGRVTTLRPAFRSSGFIFGMTVADERLVVARDGPRYEFPLDLSSAPDEPTLGSCCDPTADAILNVASSPDGAVTVRELDRRSEVVRQWVLTGVVATSVRPLSVVGDHLLVESSGRLYLVDPLGVIRQYAIGEYVASRGEWVLWSECDEQLVCALRLGDVTRSRVRRLAGVRVEDAARGEWGTQVAPDASTIVAVTGDGEALLVDAATAARHATFDHNTRVDWTPDGRWVFGRTPGEEPSRLVAVSTRDGSHVTLDLPFELSSGPVLLAVG